MSNDPARPDRARQPEHEDERDEVEEEPVTTGDMQRVGATTPEEVEERRRRTVPGEAPVEEEPGDQNSG
ncbi:MAG TPA: hypothetical protein PKD53_31620 [Chloroflexaceae bacterium]|nr:hypothetical protein [Chloroflexaceae bacterium]